LGGFLTALQFLTILPVGRGAAPRSAPVWFPVAGGLLGLCAAAMLKLSALAAPPALAGALALLLLVLVTGGLHEDGLADIADACRAWRSPERIHEILKDSRIGAHGAAAIGLSLLIRAQAMAALLPAPWTWIPAAVALSRGGPVLLAAVSKPAGEGLGRKFRQELDGRTAIVVAVQCAAAALLCGLWPAIALLAVLGLALPVARLYFHRRLGGVTGDCLGAFSQIVESASLVVLVCLRSV